MMMSQLQQGWCQFRRFAFSAAPFLPLLCPFQVDPSGQHLAWNSGMSPLFPSSLAEQPLFSPTSCPLGKNDFEYELWDEVPC